MSPELMYSTFAVEQRVRLADPYLALRRQRRLQRQLRQRPPLPTRLRHAYQEWRQARQRRIRPAGLEPGCPITAPATGGAGPA